MFSACLDQAHLVFLYKVTFAEQLQVWCMGHNSLQL